MRMMDHFKEILLLVATVTKRATTAAGIEYDGTADHDHDSE